MLFVINKVTIYENKILILIGLMLAFGTIWLGCNSTSTSAELDVEEITLIAKSSYSKQKGKKTEYACLISTLGSDSAEYNYWNQSYWVFFPESIIKEAKGITEKKLWFYGKPCG